jgi:putative component of membrane protein insertase Oxa1/YidC/SpoIIIJ protein YidD
MFKKITILLIKIYQITISPDHSFLGHFFSFWRCSNYPSCSEYTKLVIEQEGLFNGLKKGTKRIISCH